jgi:hypothetical protein
LVPTVHLDSSSPELDRVLEDAGAFAALLIDGMVGHRMVVGDRQILRLLGPGDIIVHTWAPRSEILSDSRKRVENHAEIALLGRQLVHGARHFPGLIVGLHLRLGDQHQRLAVQIDLPVVTRAGPAADDNVAARRELGPSHAVGNIASGEADSPHTG